MSAVSQFEIRPLTSASKPATAPPGQPDSGAPLPLVHVLGAQRSGTNYLVELIRRNVTGQIYGTGDRSLCWKHALPSEKRGAPRPAGEAILSSVALICLIAKHPERWIASILHGGTHDLFLKRRDLLAPSGTPDITKTMAFYEAFYSLWVDVLERRHFVQDGPFVVCQYEQLIRSPTDILGRIADYLSLRLHVPIEIPKKIPYSKRMNPQLEPEAVPSRVHKLTKTEAEIVGEYKMSNRLLERLGYV